MGFALHCIVGFCVPPFGTGVPLDVDPTLSSTYRRCYASPCNLNCLLLVLLQRSCLPAVKCTRYTERGTNTPLCLCCDSV